MKINILAAMMLATTAMPATAQDDDGGNITQVFYFDIKTGHGPAFNAGFEAYWECYRENGGQREWSAWNPASGNVSGVMFRSGGHNWADFDEDNPVGEACTEVFETSVGPHFDEIYTGYRETLTDVSRDTDDPVNLVMAIDFDVSDQGAAMEVIAAWHEAFEAADWGKYVWIDRVTSSDGWNLTVALLNENFADMAPGERSFGEIQRAHHGDEKAAELGAKWRGIVTRSRSRMFRKNDALSFELDED